MRHAPTAVSDPAGTAAARIREDIIAGVYAPGQRLVEAELCGTLHASRATVRAALAALAHEGLVERIAHRGARVRTVSVEEAIAITEVRMVVEGLCAAKAAANITDEEIVELREIGSQMKECVASGDVLTYRLLNVRLHDRVREIADQPIATETLNRLVARNVRHQFRLGLRPGRAQISISEHLAIIDEVCARQPEAAERAARRHVESVIRALRETPPG